jgi:type VI secretion system protein ImpM
VSRCGAITLSWFGKLRACGDFVRSTQQGALTQALDHWLSRGLAQLAQDPAWKQLYDRAGTAHFAALGTRSRVALAGHLMPGADATGRRFPFAAGAFFDIDAPSRFMACAPVALSPLWGRLEDLARRARDADDAAQLLAEAQRTPLALGGTPQSWTAKDAAFMSAQTLGSLQALLQHAHPALDLRRTLLGLGLLLQPVPSSGRSRLATGLRLPMPSNGLLAGNVGAWWMRLVTPFLARGDFEVLLLLPRTPQGAPPSLVLGFAGATPALLCAWLAPAQAARDFIGLQAPAWVDAHLERDAALRRLDAYLRQHTLPLAQAAEFFNDCFLAE